MSLFVLQSLNPLGIFILYLFIYLKLSYSPYPLILEILSCLSYLFLRILSLWPFAFIKYQSGLLSVKAQSKEQNLLVASK